MVFIFFYGRVLGKKIGMYLGLAKVHDNVAEVDVVSLLKSRSN